ncbi:hypothetical protein WOLCODRAFT_159812 [Wolfiporia cocos MD-104 SS10]|uniref:DUF6534 domain-containing protein n=1 Tax=Wolfiporia cocos (strain MD-104) TaxID=742152 RepID=A0A2H3ISU7_WOLCO|nr:hypothetical protein WOLCODRAFT_159812 [Wolfiporia cocos MD-104 SS10]
MSAILNQHAIEELVKPTLGAILLGLVFSTTFFGVTLLQMYQYYDRCWTDSIWLKLFVALIGILDALQVMTVIHSNWWYLIQNYANPSSLAIVPWSLGVEVGFTTSIGLLVQCFFALRVYILSRGNRPITLSIVLLTLTQFVLGVYYADRGQATKLVSTIATITWVSTASLACSIAGDVLIAGALCFYLHRARSGGKRTDKLIDVMIVYTVNTGLLTTICAVCTIILSEVVPDSYWDTVFYFMISKCYVNSTLATWVLNCAIAASKLNIRRIVYHSYIPYRLNAREKLRTGNWNTSSVSTPAPIADANIILAQDTCASSGTAMEFATMPGAAKTHYTETALSEESHSSMSLRH